MLSYTISSCDITQAHLVSKYIDSYLLSRIVYGICIQIVNAGLFRNYISIITLHFVLPCVQDSCLCYVQYINK